MNDIKLTTTSLYLQLATKYGDEPDKVKGALFVRSNKRIGKRVAKLEIKKEMKNRNITEFHWIHTLNSVAKDAAALSKRDLW
jgi:hypothetical protein